MIEFACWIVRTQPFETVDDFLATLKYPQHRQNDLTHLLADIAWKPAFHADYFNTKFFRDYEQKIRNLHSMT